MANAKTSSAGRLHSTIVKLKAQLVEQNNQGTLLNGLRGVLAGRNDDTDIIAGFVRLAALPQVVDRQMRALDDLEPTLYLSWVSEVSSALATRNFELPLANVANQIGPHVLSLIALCDDRLRRSRFAEDVIDNNRIKQLREEAASFAQAVHESDLEQSIKDYVLYHIRLAEQAVTSYQTMGAEAFERAGEASIGSVVSHPDAVDALSKKPLYERFKKFVGFVCMMAKLVEAVDRLEGVFSRVLAIHAGTGEDPSKLLPPSH